MLPVLVSCIHPKQTPHLVCNAKAPANSLAEHTEALREELQLQPEIQVSLSTTRVLGSNKKNAARQYKRAVHRFGFSLKLGVLVGKRFLWNNFCLDSVARQHNVFSIDLGLIWSCIVSVNDFITLPKNWSNCFFTIEWFLLQGFKKIHFTVQTTWIPRNVPSSMHHFEENGSAVTLPYLKPTDMLKWLLCSEPWLLLGGLEPGREAENLLSTFWRLFRSEHGSHQVFEMASSGQVSLAHTIPIFLHGDGGRTQKKQPLEVVSFRPALGLDTEWNELKCTCCNPETYRGNDKQDPVAQKLNNKNHSYLTHFLMFAFPSKKFKKTPSLLLSLLEAVSIDLRVACLEGIQVKDQRYYVAVLGMAGDMEYHSKTGLLTRSWQNVGHRNFIPCCHECGAGDLHFPFEDVSFDAAWKSTMYRTPPRSHPPPFHHIPFEDWMSGGASRFFKRDPFHIFRLGIARNFIGSTIVLFSTLGLFDTPHDGKAFEARLDRAWNSFLLWCAGNSCSPSSLRSFSKEKLHCPKKGQFPWLACKGSDTILLLKWLRFFSGLHAPDNPTSTVLPLVVKATDNGLSFQRIHRHGIWLKPSCRNNVACAVKKFVECYARLAHYALGQGYQLYAMVPKLHAADHIAVHLEQRFRDPYSCNPAMYDCSMSEDFIGRVSRQSRRISYVQVVENTLLAYKVKAKFIIKNFKKHRFQTKKRKWQGCLLHKLFDGNFIW